MNTLPVKTETETFDRTFFYRIREGKIECKPIVSSPKEKWVEIPFPKKATRLSADQNLLIAIDENQRVYKACRSFFSKEIVWKVREQHTMAEAKAVSVAHQRSGNTIYMLSPSGNRIFSASNYHFCHEILGPEGGRFVAENLSASGSTLFLLQRAHGTHKMYTLNVGPFGGSKWLEQPSIPLAKAARLTKHITALHTIKGCQLRVEGTDQGGTSGYYVKKLADRTWTFQPTRHSISRGAFLSKGTPKPQLLKEKGKGQVQIDGNKFRVTFKKAPAGEFKRSLEIRLSSKKTLICPLQKHGPKWRLIAPKDAPPSLRKLSVTMHKEGDELLITGKKFKAQLKRSRCSLSAESSLSLMGSLFFRMALWCSMPMTHLLHLLERIFHSLFPYSNHIKAAQERLRESLQLKDQQDTSVVIKQLVKKDPSLAPRAVTDFLCSSSAIPRLNRLMQGANARVCGSKGDRLFQAWKQCKGAKQRISSHAHQPGTSYGLEIPLFGELLFWKDAQGHLRLQFEAHSLNSPFQIHHHSVDYMHYRLSGKQQGLYGASKHVDSIPIDL